MQARNVVVSIALCLLLSSCVAPQQTISKMDPPGQPALFGMNTQPVQPVTTAKTSKRLDDQLNNLTEQIVNDLKEGQKSKIAIIEFSDLDGDVSNLGKYVSEELTTRLYRTKRFQVVERELLKKVMAEHKLNLSGAIDESTAVEVGRILGVDAIATGTISDLGRYVKVNARLISTERGSIFAVASAEILKDDRVQSLVYEPGEGEKPVAYQPSFVQVQNLTPMATITASSVYGPNFFPAKVADGVVRAVNQGEWVSRGQRQGAWLLLQWSEPREITRIVLYDRANIVAQVLEGTLSFSDGTTIRTGQLPNHGAPKEFTFEPKYVNWVKFAVDYAQGVNIGLAEIEVFGR